VGGDNVRK